MSAEDKKRLDTIKSALAAGLAMPTAISDIEWLVSKLEEAQAELAQAKEGEHVQATITKQRMEHNHYLSARLAKVKGQRDRLAKQFHQCEFAEHVAYLLICN